MAESSHLHARWQVNRKLAGVDLISRIVARIKDTSMTRTLFMLRSMAFALLTLAGLAVSAQAAVIVTSSAGTDVPGLPGYKSYTITATSNVVGEQIQGVDFAGDGSNDPATGKGFFGSMNQLGPPTLNTTYQDNNNLIPLLNVGHTSAEDSQFLVNSGASNIAHPSGFDEESSTILQGIWAWTDPQGQSVNFAQLVLPNSASAPVTFRGSFSLNTTGGIIDTPSVTGTVPPPPVPEPATITLLGLAAFGFAGRRRK